ncbi:MAG: iron-containing alcohol dehydrogenase [Desulfobacterales bacterium]|nr:iron-containing alcohol dehydrogenase [Desulfobacterales bacterium]
MPHGMSYAVSGLVRDYYTEGWPGKNLADGLINIMRAIGVPNGLSGVGYTADDLDALADKGWKQRRVVENAARQITKEEMGKIFAGALSYW